MQRTIAEHLIDRIRCQQDQGVHMSEPASPVAVIFLSTRTDGHGDEYQQAAADMEAAARRQPGFLRLHSVRDPATGAGVTVSLWVDEPSALEFKQVAEHRKVQQAGRDRFYQDYEVIVAQVTRTYRFST
jgi:heme-degrading monooxygenase HmoA